jgi:hypothetical protein
MTFGSRRLLGLGPIVLSVLIGSMLSACTPELRSSLSDLGINLPPPVPEVPSVPDAQAGWIVGSIGEIPEKMFSLTSEGSPYGTIRVSFRNEAGTISSAIPFSTGEFDPTLIDFQDKDEKSAVFAIKLPEGNYVIDGLRFSESGDLQGRPCFVKDRLAVPFTVTHGKAAYLGSLIASADWGKNRMGLMAATCGYFVVRDRSTRDAPVIRQKFPAVADPLEVHLLMANSGEAQKYFRAADDSMKIEKRALFQQSFAGR